MLNIYIYIYYIFHYNILIKYIPFSNKNFTPFFLPQAYALNNNFHFQFINIIYNIFYVLCSVEHGLNNTKYYYYYFIKDYLIKIQLYQINSYYYYYKKLILVLL